jgi:anti-sigma regulatory factor (Ser/Thr protein kinase)
MSSSPQQRQGQGASKPGERLVFELSGGVDAPLEARRALLAGDNSIPAAIREDILLLTTELVTNAVRHGGVGPEQSLNTEVRWWPGRVRVDVTDPSPASDFGARSQESGEGGWGLYLVDQIAHRWGIKRTPFSTKVWFELKPEM